MPRKYNIVIFGATGFTGKHVILEILKTLKKSSDNEKFTWAVAGRSVSKLDNVLAEMSRESGACKYSPTKRKSNHYLVY
jgi:short subunit dehydrogenase-like uncharacterized protein